MHERGVPFAQFQKKTSEMQYSVIVEQINTVSRRADLFDATDQAIYQVDDFALSVIGVRSFKGLFEHQAAPVSCYYIRPV